MNMTLKNNLPVLGSEGGLSAYLEQIKKFPMLDAEEEYMLAKNWKTTGNIKSAEKFLEGTVIDTAAIDKTADLAVDSAVPITDVRGSAEYRKELIRVLTKRTLNICLERLA